MSVHLTPTELADEMNMKRRDVLFKCIQMNVPSSRVASTRPCSNPRFGRFRHRKQATA